MTPINVYVILVIFLCFADHSSKKTAFNDVPPNSTWNEILVSSNDSAQRFSSQKLLVRNWSNSTQKNFNIISKSSNCSCNTQCIVLHYYS